MKQELWAKILSFDLDENQGDYRFSLRLADENFWTENFTRLAILEYKKFMYLAATSDLMVSPSEIVDVVWHQHLIFTKSYSEFCAILGRQIQHVPSTHDREELGKFKQAKERTSVLYMAAFGNQLRSVWEFSTMFESLNLEKAKYKLRGFIAGGLLVFLILIFPFYLILKPIYIQIDNPYFLYYFIGLTIITFGILEMYNRTVLRNAINAFDPDSFIFRLKPLELIYLKTLNITNVIHSTVNELVKTGRIEIYSDNKMKLVNISVGDSAEENQVITLMDELGKTHYPAVVKRLVRKPVFANIANSMDALKKYFNKSKVFNKLFYINFCVLNLTLLLGITRLNTGLSRDKPVAEIFLVVLILLVTTAVYLYRLTNLFLKQSVPKFYKSDVLAIQPVEIDWQWNYFLFGTAALVTSFAPMVTYTNVNYANSSDSVSCGTGCGSSGGSSCGSSCGGSCGGCGGD